MKAATNQNKVSSCWLRTNVMFCFEAASKPKPATISMISHESASMVSKSSKIDDQKLKELGREQSRTRRRLQAFSRKIFPRRASKAKSGQKYRNAVEPERDAPTRILKLKEKRHHGEISRTALLSTPPNLLCSLTSRLRTSDDRARAC